MLRESFQLEKYTHTITCNSGTANCYKDRLQSYSSVPLNSLPT